MERRTSELRRCKGLGNENPQNTHDRACEWPGRARSAIHANEWEGSLTLPEKDSLVENVKLMWKGRHVVEGKHTNNADERHMVKRPRTTAAEGATKHRANGNLKRGQNYKAGNIELEAPGAKPRARSSVEQE
ncbi:hypothetical protein R1flu_010560 [Riccia fluitans]|uniref:Uncharacterized protein n=1 Tax=Riccia fluitans TaxID=41844 RepID=A0ABD1Z5B3_9MARC